MADWFEPKKYGYGAGLPIARQGWVLTIGDKGGVKQSMSIHVRFLQGETTIRWVKRFDGQPLWRAPLTPKKGSTRSPFIQLGDPA